MTINVTYCFKIPRVLDTLPEAADLAQNRPLWSMMSTYGATQS